MTVLIADDNGMIREVIATLLRHHGYTVLEAENGSVAMEILEQRRVDLVLTDNDMPLMTGFDLIQAMVTDMRFTLIPIVMMSGQHEVRQRALNIGAAAFIAKPFNNRTLVALIKRLTATKR